MTVFKLQGRSYLLFKDLLLHACSPCRIFFLKFLADTHVLFWGHWYPCFGFLVTSPLGFKARVGSALFAFCVGECNVHSLRSTSGAILANLVAASTQLVLSPHIVADVRLLGFELVLTEYLWVRRSTNWAKPGPIPCRILPKYTSLTIFLFSLLLHF